MSFDHAGENVAQVREGFDPVELAGFDEGTDDGPAFAAAIASGKKMVFASESSGPYGAFDGIGVEIDVAIIKKAGEAIPSRKGVAYGFGELAASAKARKLVVESLMKPFDHWLGMGTSSDQTVRGRLATHLCFDGINLSDPA